MTHCPNCHKPIIPDLPGRAPMSYTPWGDDSETFILCQTCAENFLAEIKKKKTDKAKQNVIFAFLKKISMVLVLVFLAVAAVKAFGEEVSPKSEWVKGGVVIGTTGEGCVFKPFVKVGDAEDDEDGNTQILGYEPGNVQVNRKGEVVWERVRERVFIPLNRAKQIGGRLCKCPPFDE